MEHHYRLARTTNIEIVKSLHSECMPHDNYDLSGQLWLVHDETDAPVAFCAARKLKDEPGVFLNRAGVLPCANGQGLQRRMINARLRWCREIGVEYALTYTLYHNHASIVNLLKCGFKFDEPNWKWAGDVHYFIKEL